MNWILLLMIIGLIYLGIDYGRLLYKIKQDNLPWQINFPHRNIFISAKNSDAILHLKEMDIEAHQIAEVGISKRENKLGLEKIYYENNDELWSYCYEDAQIGALTPIEINNYKIKIFFDNELPDGAIRAVIKDLGLTDYMVNIGICSEKSGGK